MQRGYLKYLLVLISVAFIVLVLCTIMDKEVVNETSSLKIGTRKERQYIVDNTLSSEYGDIHFSSYIPDHYDGNTPYALFITLPGWEGLYFQGVGANLVEYYGDEAMKYNDQMIVLSPQLDDYGEVSANMTIELTKYFIKNYNIDTNKVYLEGLSGGGETGSLVLEKAPDLYTAYLGVSSSWDGSLDKIVQQRLPIYLVIGREDSYYGSQSFIDTYETLKQMYQQDGLSIDKINDILVLDIKEQEFFDAHGYSDQHAGSFLFAYEESIMSWLFEK